MMPKIADLCVLFMNDKGEESIRFRRLSWWISVEGFALYQSLTYSPEYAGSRTVPFDSNGYPLRFTQESARQVERFAQALAGTTLPSLVEAEARVAALLARDLQGVVSRSPHGWDQKVDQLLHFLYRQLISTQDDWFYLTQPRPSA